MTTNITAPANVTGGASGFDVTIQSPLPDLLLNENDRGTDEKLWDIVCQDGVMYWRCANDAKTAVNVFMTLNRSGNTVTSLGIFCPVVFTGINLGSGVQAGVNGAFRVNDPTNNRYRSDFISGSGQVAINAYDDTGAVHLPLEFDSLSMIANPVAGTGGFTSDVDGLAVHGRLTTDDFGVFTAFPFYATHWKNSALVTSGYRKVGDMVEIRGSARQDSGAYSSTIGTLPLGYRPSAEKRIPTYITVLSVQVPAYVKITTAGDVQVVPTSGQAEEVFLDPIRFSVLA